MNKKELAKEVYNISHLTGDFLLSSGNRSDEYFDKYKIIASPQFPVIIQKMKSLIPADTEVLAGLETGGIPLATALFLKTGIPPAFVRKEAKGYGTCNLIEGADIFNKKVCTLEDIITTARQVIKSVQAMREAGARIDTVLCLILREAAAIETLAKEGLTLKYVFTMDYIKKSAGIASR